jgi:DNA-binding CsgD family transcriptional regulator
MVLALTSPPAYIFHFIPRTTMANAEINRNPANQPIHPNDSSQSVSAGSANLSDRELQVIELVAGGLTNQDIAEALAISKRTVDNHISNILTKTQTDNRVALVRWALQWGKVCIDEVNCCMIPVPKLQAPDLAGDETPLTQQPEATVVKGNEPTNNVSPLSYVLPEDKMQRVS